jgi:hypothetical protein
MQPVTRPVWWKVSEAKRLRELAAENAKLRKLLAEAHPEKR